MAASWRFSADLATAAFHTTFGLYRSSMGGGVTMDEQGRHDTIQSYKRTEEQETAAYKDAGLRTYKKGYSLADPSLLVTPL